MTVTSPKVSILTTVYNREKYLQECLESVQAGHFQDYEHIVVDDRSKDSSLSIAKTIAKTDSRIKVHLNEHNLGDYTNRNKAASYASGTYLKYLDADDKHGRWVLDIMVDAMDAFPEAGLGLFDAGAYHYPTLLSSADAFSRHYSGKSSLFHRSPLSALIPKKCFEAVGGFQTEPFTGDFNLWHRLAAEYPVVIFPNRYTFYRQHDDQQSEINKANPIDQLSHLFAKIESLSNSSYPIEQNLRVESLQKANQQMARVILRHCQRGNWKAAQSVRHKIKWSWATVMKMSL